MKTEREMRDALLGHWEAIPKGERTAALDGSWYQESRRVAQALAGEYGVSLSTVAGVIAALSPRVHWADNVKGAETVLHRAAYPDVFGPGGELEGLGRGVPGFGANIAKAERIAAGEAPLRVLGGDKVRAFYRAIMGDSDAAVVDMWMLRAIGEPAHAKLTTRQYAAVAEALRAAAREAGIDTADFQAVVWTYVRGSAE